MHINGTVIGVSVKIWDLILHILPETNRVFILEVRIIRLTVLGLITAKIFLFDLL